MTSAGKLPGQALSKAKILKANLRAGRAIIHIIDTVGAGAPAAGPPALHARLHCLPRPARPPFSPASRLGECAGGVMRELGA